LESELLKGYSTIEPYYLLWVDDCQGGQMTNLLVNSTSILSYTISNIPPGSICRFRMNVLNIIGYSSQYSPTLPVLFARIPDAPLVPHYVARSGGDATIGLEPFITISWEEPYETGGIPILGYLVKLSEDGGDWSLAYDGSVEPNVYEHTFLGLKPGSVYLFQVWSRNELGTSSSASPSLEVYAATYPGKMDPVTQVSVTENGLSSSILLTWQPAQYNGAKQVLGYYI
jgi:hypothetical protein